MTLCQRPDHLELVTKAENTRRRHQRPGMDKPPAPLANTFSIALFGGIDRPAVEQKTVDLDQLRQMLSRFEVLADKRRGRCWSPTRYAHGANSRGNAGVLEVSALVFDLDRIPPDTDRLAGVYWIGHTTWSHKPTAPRWRVVIPLTSPHPSWALAGHVGACTRGAVPKADPACKDPSRAYWLPSHSGGVTAKATCHDAPLLDPSTLPALPPEPKRPELQHTPSAQSPRPTTDSDQRRGEAYMASVVASLAETAPGGRNAALNRAAWTLGQWVGAGALEQERRGGCAVRGRGAQQPGRRRWPAPVLGTIRSGLGAGLLQPIDLDAKD